MYLFDCNSGQKEHTAGSFYFADEEFDHLDWSARMRIVMGIAYCLQHMHELNPPIAHPDLQSSSICMADDYAAKVNKYFSCSALHISLDAHVILCRLQISVFGKKLLLEERYLEMMMLISLNRLLQILQAMYTVSELFY